MTDEFKEGDIVAKIGMPECRIIWQMDVLESNPDLTRCFLREVEAQKDGMYEWTDENSDNYLLEDFEFMKLMRDGYVKVGKWDFEKNLEVEDEDDV